MPGISFLKIFMIFGIVSSWSQKALEDGKITLDEAAELATDLGAHLGVTVEIEIGTPPRPRVEPLETEETGNPTLEIEDEQPPEGRRVPLGGLPADNT